MISISVLLTCHNRKTKTVACLRSLKKALESYNSLHKDQIVIEVFLTDDGCTDGTAVAARKVFPDKGVLHILQGDGNLYWAAGMRFAWNEALNQKTQWDFYLLLNDDVELMENVFDELLVLHTYSLDTFGRSGLYSGHCCDPKDHTKRTFGGHRWINRFKGLSEVMIPTGRPELCDITNANILMVSSDVVAKIGIFNKGFHHGGADYSYSILARDKGIPVLLTCHFCGVCEFDHPSSTVENDKIINMSFKERKSYLRHPLRCMKDRLVATRINDPIRLPMVILGNFLILYFPKIHVKLVNKRKK